MKTQIPVCFVPLLALGGGLIQIQAAPMGTAFSYQGYLTEGGRPAHGLYDFRFAIYDAPTNGTELTLLPPTILAVPVNDGLFRVTLDFGEGIFNGDAVWLEIAVRTNAPLVKFQTLSPRQPLSPVPYALHAANAGLASSVASNSISSFSIANGAVTAAKIASGQVVKSLNGLTDAVTLAPGSNITITPSGNSLIIGSTGGPASWSLTGNPGTSPGLNFLGTTDNQPLELRAGNRRVLRLEPGTEFAPNVIAGSTLNSVAAGVRGATISGGGTTNASGFTNVITAIGDIGLGVRAADGGTVPGTGELGNYVYLEFNAEYPVRLISARWNFSNSIVYVGSGPSLVPTTNHGVTSWSFSPVPGSQVLTATFTGFDPGDSLMLGLDLNRGTTGTPYGLDYEAGSLELTFSDGTVLTRQFRAFDSFNARASFVTESVAAFANRVSADYGTISGGRGNLIGPQALGAVVSGGYYNTVLTNSAHCSIGGGIHNQIGPDTGYSVIGGGQDNKIGPDGVYATVAGGYGNTVGASAALASIGGGGANTVGQAAEHATIGAGQQNSIGANATCATICGGGQNRIGTNSLSGAVGGGWANTIADNSLDGTIAGGSYNSIGTRSDYCSIGGGRENAIGTNSTFATICGGGQNRIGTNSLSGAVGGGWGNTIGDNSWDGTIAGGSLNSIGTNSYYSAIGGGRNNTVNHNAYYAVIPGGQYNFATNYAFAAGRRAKARHTGAFVCGDSTDADIASTNANSVTIRASGGYRLFSDTNATTGVRLASGSGSWTSMCDRNAKENFAPVDVDTVVAKVVALPIATWNYKSQDPAIRHMGPTAQDFKAAFGLGESDTGITTIDADGVALGAIQGLNRKLEARSAELEARNRELEQKNAALERQVAELKALVQALADKVNGGGQ
jgi:hypothetical protein